MDLGKWKVRVKKDQVTFTQTLQSPLGYAYVYEKTLKLDKHQPILILEHHIKNTGTKAIDTQVYDHDFFMLDNRPIGPGMVVHLGFPPMPEEPFPPSATIAGNDIVFNQATDRSPQGYLTGYTGQPGEYRIALEDTAAHIGVEQTSTSPVAKFYFWSTPKTICPEAYIAIHVLPHQTQTWTISYRFRAE